jgi:alpha-beta hydrolase superfamily lysophospholipase
MDLFERIKQAREQAKTSSRDALNTLFGHEEDAAAKLQKRSVDPKSEEGKRQRRQKKTPAQRFINSPIGAALFSSAEHKFLFEPDAVFSGADPAPEPKHPAEYGLEGYEAYHLSGPNSERYLAWYKPAAEGFPTIAYCPGNAGPLSVRSTVIKAMSDRGFGVMIVAYPGFKGSKIGAKGQPQYPSEPGCKRAAYAMVQNLEEHFHVPTEQIVLFGESLGGAMALSTARDMERGQRVRNSKNPVESWRESGEPKEGEEKLGLVGRVQKAVNDSLFPEPRLKYIREPRKPAVVIGLNIFASMRRRVKEEYPLLPVNSMQNSFDSERIVKDVKTDILLLHAIEDEVTGPHHSRILKEEGGDNITLDYLEGTSHRLAKPGEEMVNIDVVNMVLDKAQLYMADRGLCPAPGVKLEDAPMASDMHRQALRDRDSKKKAVQPHLNF